MFYSPSSQTTQPFPHRIKFKTLYCRCQRASLVSVKCGNKFLHDSVVLRGVGSVLKKGGCCKCHRFSYWGGLCILGGEPRFFFSFPAFW